MFEDVLERTAQPPDTVRAAGDERVERDRAHERLARGLRQHLVELVDDQIGELVRRVVIPDDPPRVVHLDRIRHGEDPALARADPDRLIVHRPVHRVPVTRLLQEIHRDDAVREPGAHPADGPGALVARDRGRDALDERALLVLAQMALLVGVGHAVPEDLVAARP
jgi:hypothetical protein